MDVFNTISPSQVLSPDSLYSFHRRFLLGTLRDTFTPIINPDSDNYYSPQSLASDSAANSFFSTESITTTLFLEEWDASTKFEQSANSYPLIKDNISNADKDIELARYRDLVTATLDYFIDNSEFQIKTEDFDSYTYYKKLKEQTVEHFQKGRLTKLKQWFRDLTEPQREAGDFKFNNYLKTKTGQDIDIFQDYYNRVDKIIAKGKISTDNQFYDVNSMVDLLAQAVPIDSEKLTLLNKLLTDYEQLRNKKHLKS